MTNHVYLLVTPETADGSSHFVQDIGREYVQHINKTYPRNGTLFDGQGNFGGRVKEQSKSLVDPTSLWSGRRSAIGRLQQVALLKITPGV